MLFVVSTSTAAAPSDCGLSKSASDVVDLPGKDGQHRGARLRREPRHLRFEARDAVYEGAESGRRGRVAGLGDPVGHGGDVDVAGLVGAAGARC